MQGVPWKPYGWSDEDKLKIALPDTGSPTEVTLTKPKELIPRSFRITKSDLVKYGHTPQCPGCFADRNSKVHKPHSAKCRERLAESLMSDPVDRRRIEAARERSEN